MDFFVLSERVATHGRSYHQIDRRTLHERRPLRRAEVVFQDQGRIHGKSAVADKPYRRMVARERRPNLRLQSLMSALCSTEPTLALAQNCGLYPPPWCISGRIADCVAELSVRCEP